MKNNKQLVKSNLLPIDNGALSAIPTVGKLIDAIKDYAIITTQEKTERERIQATLVASLREINTKNDQEMAKIMNSHEQRMQLVGMLKQGLEYAVSRDNSQLVREFN